MKIIRGLVVVFAAVLAVGVATPAAAVPSPQDMSYLVAAHQGNLAAIAAGDLAAQKGASQQVRDLGALFAADHAKLDADLAAVAAQVKVPLPAAPDQFQQSVLKELQDAPAGAVFDQMWITKQLRAQGDAQHAVSNELNFGYDERVKELARDADPILIAHNTELIRADADVNAPA